MLRAVRAELAELRAQLAERDRSVVLLTDQNTALRAQLARSCSASPGPPSTGHWARVGATSPRAAAAR